MHSTAFMDVYDVLPDIKKVIHSDKTTTKGIMASSMPILTVHSNGSDRGDIFKLIDCIREPLDLVLRMISTQSEGNHA
jgi:hypothetical protein